jgi:hypothetical protein
MGATASITAIGATHGRKFSAQKMFIACATVAAAAEYAYLVYKIAFFQNCDLV